VYAGRYKTYEESFDGLPIRIHSYAMERRGLPEKMAKLANGIIRYYEEFLGPYPFEELEIVEVPEYGFGVAPSGVVLLTTEAYKPLAALSAFFVRGVNARLAHEIAHHWFGHAAMVDNYRDTWLGESFAEYVSALAMEALKPKGSTKIIGFEDMLVDWRNMSNECESVGSVLAANQIAGNEAFRHRIGLLYNRGPMLLHMLRTMVGDDQFLAMLRLFLERADMGIVTTSDFRATVREVRGFDMAWFFEQWISRSGIPDVHFKYRVTSSDGTQILSGTLDQPPERFKKLVVPIVIELGGGERFVRVVVQNEPITNFKFEIPGTPRKVSIDPNRNNLAHYHGS
jgi:aminopeptidase N